MADAEHLRQIASDGQSMFLPTTPLGTSKALQFPHRVLLFDQVGLRVPGRYTAVRQF